MNKYLFLFVCLFIADCMYYNDQLYDLNSWWWPLNQFDSYIIMFPECRFLCLSFYCHFALVTEETLTLFFSWNWLQFCTTIFYYISSLRKGTGRIFSFLGEDLVLLGCRSYCHIYFWFSEFYLDSYLNLDIDVYLSLLSCRV